MLTRTSCYFDMQVYHLPFKLTSLPPQKMPLIIMKARNYTHTFAVSFLSNNIFCSDFILLVSFYI